MAILADRKPDSRGDGRLQQHRDRLHQTNALALYRLRPVQHLVCSVTGRPFTLSLYLANLAADPNLYHLTKVKLKLRWKTHRYLLSNKKPALGGLLFKPFFLKSLSPGIDAPLRHEDAPEKKTTSQHRTGSPHS
ncbi:TPA: hypothetical protein G8Z63_004367 [Salmonella enterica]|nr:hypothetical protein [Salmonella enterica]HAG3378745.1 hypothetical protein [Salmonella enterica]